MCRSHWCLLLVSGCTEYNLGTKPDHEGTTTSETEPGTDTTTPTTTTTTTTTPPTPPPLCGAMVAAAEAVPLNLACDVPPATGSFTPVVEWSLPGFNAYGPPVVGQLDDDDGNGVIDANDTPDLVFLPNTFSGITAVDGITGAVKWTSFAAVDGYSGVAIGDVDGDGIPEIAAANGPTQVVLMDNVGNLIWATPIDSAGLYAFMYPSIAD